MDKTVGKSIIVGLLIMSGVVMNAQIQLHLSDMYGNRLQHVQAGKPFVLHVIDSDAGRTAQPPKIGGIEPYLQNRRPRMQMNIINNRSTVQYSYTLRIDAPGTYELGPAEIEKNGQKQLSSKLQVHISHDEVEEPKRQKKDVHEQALVKLFVDKDHVVVGQKVVCTVRFYHVDDSIRLKQFYESDMKNLRKIGRSIQDEGEEEINGLKYFYTQISFELYPQKDGVLTIPSYIADYEQVSDDVRWGRLSRLLGPMVDTKRVYSNAAQITVDPLPQTEQDVGGVGLFSKFNASIKPPMAKEGEAMVLTLQIEGDGELETMASPALQNIPPGLKYYESKQHYHRATKYRKLARKSFEYVVQGIKAGTWEIPSQIFTYFDVDKRTYQTLKTGSLLVTVQPDTAHVTYASSSTGEEGEKEKDEKAHLIPLHADGPWAPEREGAAIPFSLFLVLAFMPLAVAAVSKRNLFRSIQQFVPRSVYRWYFYFCAQRALRAAAAQNDFKQIDTILRAFFAQMFVQNSVSVTWQSIQKKLFERGMPQAESELLAEFSAQLQAMHFGMIKSDGDQKKVISQAFKWLAKFKNIA